MTLEAIVVLGCRLGPGGRLGSAAARRAARAAALWRQYEALPVVVSGGRRWHGIAEATALEVCLTDVHGVPKRVILPEFCSLSTAENAHYSAALLRSRQVQCAGVVTCDWHMPRALECFSTAGLDVRGYPAESPHVPAHRNLWRRARERGARALDHWATWGRVQ